MDRVIAMKTFINISSLCPLFALSLSSSAKEFYKAGEAFAFLLNSQSLKEGSLVCGCSQDRVNFSVARRGHVQDPEVVLYHLMSLTRAGGRESLMSKKGSFWSSESGIGRGGLVALVSGRREPLGNAAFKLECWSIAYSQGLLR